MVPFTRSQSRTVLRLWSGYERDEVGSVGFRVHARATPMFAVAEPTSIQENEPKRSCVFDGQRLSSQSASMSSRRPQELMRLTSLPDGRVGLFSEVSAGRLPIRRVGLFSEVSAGRLLIRRVGLFSEVSAGRLLIRRVGLFLAAS